MYISQKLKEVESLVVPTEAHSVLQLVNGVRILTVVRALGLHNRKPCWTLARCGQAALVVCTPQVALDSFDA